MLDAGCWICLVRLLGDICLLMVCDGLYLELEADEEVIPSDPKILVTRPRLHSYSYDL